MRSPLGPGDPAAPEPMAGGTTSGLTALDRARRGEASAVRVLVVGPRGGGRLLDASRTVGFATTVTSDVDGAIEAVTGAEYHAVLLDDLIGDVKIALSRLHLSAPSVPVVVLASDGDGPTAVEAGADDWLDPFSL